MSSVSPQKSGGLISTWTIAILAGIAIWMGLRIGSTRVVLSGVAGLIAFFAFITSPKTKILDRRK